MGVKGHMSRGNQVGLEKTSILIRLKCSCMASTGPDRTTSILNLLMNAWFCCLAVLNKNAYLIILEKDIMTILMG